MGLFLANLHLHCPSAETPLSPEKLRDTATDLLRDDFTRIEPTEDADRILHFIQCGDWLSIFDSDNESHDLDQLCRNARLWTGCTRSLGVSFYVHDSDVLHAGLFKNDRRLDSILSDPAGMMSEYGHLPACIGKPSNFRSKQWEKLLQAGAKLNQLRAINLADSMVDVPLAHICQAIGLAEHVAFLDHRSADELEADRCVVEKAYFKSKHPPAYQRILTGAPKLRLRSFTDERSLPLDEKLQVDFSVENIGGASEGLVVLAWGAAVDEGLVEITSVTLVRNRNYLAKRNSHDFEHSTQELKPTTIDGVNYLMAKVPDFQIPPGLGELANGPEADRLMMQHLDESLNRLVYIRPEGQTKKLGCAVLNITVLPKENLDLGQVSQSTKLTVLPRDKWPSN